MNVERGGYFKSLDSLSGVTIDQLLDTLRKQNLRIEPIPPEILRGSAFGSKITRELTRLPIFLARGSRSWGGLIVCFPGKKEELTTRFVSTPYLRRILHPILELFRRLRKTGMEELQCVYILGERFPDVFLRKFRLLDRSYPMSSCLPAIFCVPAGQQQSLPLQNPRTRHGPRSCFVARWKVLMGLKFLFEVAIPASVTS